MQFFRRLGQRRASADPKPRREASAEAAGEFFWDPADSFDPTGSYTGTDSHGGPPEQDADDL